MAYTLAESGIASLVMRCNNIINGEYGDDTQKEIDDLMEEMKGFADKLKDAIDIASKATGLVPAIAQAAGQLATML